LGFGQNRQQPSFNLSRYSDSIKTIVKKRPFIAAAEVFTLNIGVWLFDRYILKGDYAYINWSTLKNNFKNGFVWDNDSFSTNLLSHPYHGSLYFNSARSNGMNFWASFPYAMGGSLMWELFMENEPSSINDLFSTAVGGTALGEVTFRLSSLILNDSKRGFNRVVRELSSAMVSPMRSFNRLSHGELTRVSPYNSFESEHSPFSISVGVGWRYLAKNNHLFRGDNGLFIDFAMEYGDPFYYDDYKPFDYFSLKAMFNILGGQPIVGSVNAIGMLWGRSSEPLPGHDMTLGVFQHYDFYQSSELRKSNVVPYEVAQTTAIGGGLMYKFPQIGNKINMSYNVYVNVIFMGGTLTDYFMVNDRNYNMGNGFSAKFQSLLEFNNMASFFVGVEHYQLFTWKGYPNEPNPIPPDMDINLLNAQGNKGHTRLTIINPRLDLNLSPIVKLSLDPFIYLRDSHYDFFDDIKYRTFETRLLLTYTF
jgi:hypothetical protein